MTMISKIDSLRVLLRVNIEISYRLHCIREYTNEISSDGSHDEYKPLAISICRALDALKSRLFDQLSVIITQKKTSGIEELNPLFVFLKTYSR